MSSKALGLMHPRGLGKRSVHRKRLVGMDAWRKHVHVHGRVLDLPEGSVDSVWVKATKEWIRKLDKAGTINFVELTEPENE